MLHGTVNITLAAHLWSVITDYTTWSISTDFCVKGEPEDKLVSRWTFIVQSENTTAHPLCMWTFCYIIAAVGIQSTRIVNSLAHKILLACDMFMHCYVLSATCTTWKVLFISKLMCQIDTVLED